MLHSNRRSRSNDSFGKFFVVVILCLAFSCKRVGGSYHVVADRNDNVENTVTIIGHPKVVTPIERHDAYLYDSLLMAKTPESISSQLLCCKAFVTSYNKDTRCPNWVAWHLTGEHVDGPVGRSNAFHEDEEVPAPRATLADYKGSGWSRGHMCPAGDNKWDETAMYESFSLVNICPQNERLNSGLWNSIEMDCRRWAKQYGDLYIVCGPLYLNREHQSIGENRVVVPEAFFKVVLCLNGTPKAFGIIVRNTDGTKKKDLYYNSVDEVERITGIDFFPALPDDIENEVEQSANMEDWR